MKYVLPKGWKTPKLGKFCHGCGYKIGNRTEVCPICATTHIETKTVKTYHKPPRKKGGVKNTEGAIHLKMAIDLMEMGFTLEQMKKLVKYI